VHIRFEDVAKVFRQNLSPRLVDFLEIAAYVFSADCATPRGKKWTDDESTEPWTRDLAFIIPVRDLAFWSKRETRSLIEEILNFLSNDRYSFTFVGLEHDRTDQSYFEFGDLNTWPFNNPDRVLMFSGGLDSLAGAVETAAGGGPLVLVSHRPVSTLDARQRALFGELRKMFPGQLVRVPVWLNKDESLGREPTQRTRSFLFAALGTLVAQSIQANGVRFYENGVVSLNLPIAQEALRARASRTTHPVVLHLLSELCSAVTDRDFAVDNPYIFKTKTEVVTTLAKHGAASLIAYTCSCSHSMFQTKNRRHCGRCSQCIDRRFATTAAGLQMHDSEKDYVLDVFVAPRKDALEKAIAVDYVRHAIELARRSEDELARIFNTELSRAVRYETRRSEAAQKIISMHKRHGGIVSQVLAEKLRENAAGMVKGALDGMSLLGMVAAKEHLSRQPDIVGEATSGADSPSKSSASVSSHNSALVAVEDSLKAVLAKFDAIVAAKTKRKTKSSPSKRDTIIFAAIVKELKGVQYCSFLNDHGLKPKWEAGDPPSYPRGYEAGNPWNKKIQDEKTRAKTRMKNYSNAELLNSFCSYLNAEFHELSRLMNSRNSR
jgi:hypothetical protein